MDELNFKEVNKISAYVLGEECFSSEESLINDIKGIMSRLSPNDMDELPKSEDGEAYEGGWTELNVYKDNELLHSLLLFQAEGIQVVRVNQEEASSYYYIGEEDKELFHDIYTRIYEMNTEK